jgi:hypothetical protein
MPLPRESKFTIRSNPHRLGPRIQFRVANDSENACDGKIIIAQCFCVHRVTIELAHGLSRGGHESTATIGCFFSSTKARSIVSAPEPGGNGAGRFSDMTASCAQPAITNAASDAAIKR